MMLFTLMRRAATKLRRNDAGQALVEFALIMPLLMLLLIGIVEFGRGWNLHQVVTDAAREGARKAAVFNPAVTLDTVTNTIKSGIATAGYDPASATITAPGWDGASGEPVTVNVSLPYRFVFFGALMKWTTGESTIDLKSSFTMRNE
jgi:Flp pilus assembly protein TadG